MVCFYYNLVKINFPLHDKMKNNWWLQRGKQELASPDSLIKMINHQTIDFTAVDTKL